MDTIVIGFPVDKYEIDKLNRMSSKKLYALAQEDKECEIKSYTLFFKYLNGDLLDTENMFWLPATVD
jgi:hypothetical protein